MARTYRFQRMGGSYYLSIPPNLITKAMLEQGVTIKAIELKDDYVVLRMEAAESGEHAESDN